MANDNFNLRGIEIEIFNPEGTTNPSSYLHFAFFIDLEANKISPPLVDWQSVNIGTPAAPVYQFQGNMPTQTLPPNNSAVRTFYIGSCVVPQSQTITGPWNPVSGVKLTFSNGVITQGDPSSRRPPVVKSAYDSLPDFGGMGFGIQSQLRSAPAQGPNPNTKHSIPDNFVVILGKVPFPYANYFEPLNPANMSNGSLMCTVAAPRNNMGNSGSVVAAGVFDCNLNSNGTKNNLLVPQIQNMFTIVAPPYPSPEEPTYPGGQSSSPIIIYWSEI